MIEVVGDLWDFHNEGKWVVITTNIGWKKDGCNPMGAGVAAAAARLFPDLPLWYGTRCQKYREKTAVCPYYEAKFILFPTKAFNPTQPWLSWRADSDLELIRRSTIQLKKLCEILRESGKLVEKVVVPLVGCQNGNLTKISVLPILRAYLDDDFILVER